MDAGVPLMRPVAGIAMGLIKEGDDYMILSDIAGVEDHLGDMDFKVAGTSEGITALQMDIKITGVTFEIMSDALAQAKEGREHILGKMAEAIDAPREQLSEHAPRISSIQIDPEKIGLLIGKGGETIRSLQEEYESQIDVNDEGQVLVYAVTGAKGDALVERIRSMTKEVEVGDEFTTARSSRRRRSAPSSSSPRAPTACCTSPTCRRATASARSRRCSTRATRSPSASSRSTRSAAASACASPRTPTSPARPRRSWPPSAPATRRWVAAATVRAAARGGDRNGRGGRDRDRGPRGGGGGRDRDRAPRARAPRGDRDPDRG